MSKNPVLNTYNFVSTSNRQPQLDSNHYELIIRQQPKQARLCSSKERDRRPVDPPPIIQLKVNGYGDEAQNFLQSPYYFMCANLVHPTDSGESFTISSRYLAGTVVSSLHKLKDIDNKDGGFFVFGDISVRVEGRYRLRFSLFEIIRDEVVHIQSAVSDVFTVYSPKAFPGMSESTFLSRSFSDQGVRIRIRKEHRIQMKRPQSNSRQSDTAEYDDDNVNDVNVNDDGIMDVPVKRKRSKSQLVPISTFKSNPPLELFDTTPYPQSQQSQQSPYNPSPNSYQQFHKFPSRQGGGSLSYPPPLGYPPQRQHSYCEDPEYGPSSRDDHTLSSPYYYGHEHYEQYKRPRISNSEVSPYDYRQPSTATPLNDNQFTTTSHHHYSSPPPLPPPPPNSSSFSSSSYHTSRRLSPLLEHQHPYLTSSTNTSHMFSHDTARHRSLDVLTSSVSSNATSLDSSFHYTVTASTSSATSLQQPPPPSESFYRPPAPPPPSSSSSFTPKPPVRSRTLPLFMNHHNVSNINNNDNDNDSLHRYNHHQHHHHDTTASLSSSNQLPTPKTSVDGLHGYNHNKQLYPSYPPLTPPNPNGSSVDSYKSGNNNNNNNSNNNNNLTPSFTQHFTSSPRPGPLQLPKSPLSSSNNDNNGIMKTNSLPIMTSNSNTNSSNTTTFLNNGDVLTSSPLLLPTNNNNLPRLPPISALTGNIDFMINKKKDNYHNEHQDDVTYYHSRSMNDNNLAYNNSNVWHNDGGRGY